MARTGRPRSPEVPEETGTCPVHGVVAMRIHRNGTTRNGSVRMRKRCPQCHADYARGS
jgi:hypothetical protein